MFAAVVMGGRGAIIEAFVPKTTDFAGNPTNSACYGVVPNTLASGLTLPTFSYPILQYDADNKRLFGCGISLASGYFECYSFDSTSWTQITLNYNQYSFPTSYLWFIYNKQIWIFNDNGPRVIDLIASPNVVQNFWVTILFYLKCFLSFFSFLLTYLFSFFLSFLLYLSIYLFLSFII